MEDFRVHKTFEERRELFNKIKCKFPNKLPIVVRRGKNSDPILKQNKFILPSDSTMHYLTTKIHSNLKISNPGDGIAFFVGDIMVRGSDLIAVVYDKYHDEDGFLYVTYTTESTFG